MPQGQREKQPKTSACYFLIGTLAPDTTQPWTDARTVIWRILLVSAALEVPFLQETWHEPARTNIRKKAVVAFVIKLYSWQLSADAWPLGPHVAFGEKDVIQLTASGKIRGTSTSVMVKPSNRHRYWMSSWSVMCQTAMLTSILPPLTA